MTVSEFDTEFDVLYNNTTSNQAPGLNPFEKSVFLTKGQEQLIQEWVNERIDSSNGGFDGTSKRQIDLSPIIMWTRLDLVKPADTFDPRSWMYKLPKNVIYILDEILVENDYINSPSKDVHIIDDEESEEPEADVDTYVKTIYTVLPINKDEYLRLMSKPYKYPPKNTVWRLLHIGYNPTGESTYIGDTAEIIGRLESMDSSMIEYRMRYIKKPKPIILEDLTNLGVSIDGETLVSTSELPESTHREILERAVTLARIAWQGTTLTQAASAAQAQIKE